MKKTKILILGTIISIIVYGTYSANASQNTKITKNLSNILKNEEVSVKLFEVKKIADKKYEIYEDSQQNQYIYLNNDLVGFYKDNSVNLISRLNATAMLAIPESKENMINNFKNVATDIAKNVINPKKTDLSNYELTDYYYHDTYKEFTYTFTKLIDGYYTNDSISISLGINGQLTSFSAPRQGMFNKYENIKINENSVNNFVKKEVDNFMVNYKNEDKFINYSIDNKFINIVKDKPILELYVGLEFKEHKESIVLYYEI